MAVRVAKRYHQLKLNFCIITFYDPQRAAILRALENEIEDFPLDCVYNVDSFQGTWRPPCINVGSLRLSANHHSTWSGNEADFVILSSVRTMQPGFLKSQPRMNVALTRCRKGMVVVSHKSFLQSAGGNTLLGQLCCTWSRHHDACWVDWKAMLNNFGALPGLPAPAPPRPNGKHSHNLGGRTTLLPRNPPQQSQTQTHQDQAFPSIRIARHGQPWATRAAALEASQSAMSQSYHRHAGSGLYGGAQSVTKAVRRDLDDDEFPSLQPLATALDPTLSSRQRSRTGRK